MREYRVAGRTETLTGGPIANHPSRRKRRASSTATEQLGAALAALPQPGLPENVDARLRAAVEEECRRNRRRPGWPELVALLILAAVIAAPFAWRSLPPAASTMDAVRAAVDTRRANVVPTPPETAIARGRMTADEREALEGLVKASIVATCTPRFALEQLVASPHLARNAVRASARRLAQGAPWPAPPADMPAGDPVFVRRDWDGSIVIRFGEDEAVGDRYVFRRVDGRWLIDEVVHRGGEGAAQSAPQSSRRSRRRPAGVSAPAGRGDGWSGACLRRRRAVSDARGAARRRPGRRG